MTLQTRQQQAGKAVTDDRTVASEARRILRRLCETGAVLAVAPDLPKAVVLRGDVRMAVVDRGVAQAFALNDWIHVLRSGKASELKLARKLFLKEHGTVFKVLRSMQNAYYRSDDRRERFVSLCHDIDVQRLTFDAYMNKRLVAARPLAHLKIGVKNVLHLMGVVSPKWS